MDRPYEIIGDKSNGRTVRVTGDHPMFSAVGVPVGYECDGASIPSWLRWLCGHNTDEPRVIAAIVHDYCYETHCVSRAEADLMYRENLIALGISRIRAYAEYYAVRVFGGSHWN